MASDAEAAPTAAPALILSPHPDDVVLGCWSALDHLGRAANVVNVFAGIPPAGTRGGWDSECGVPDSVEMMCRRRQEDEAALGLVGVVPVHLDFLDRQYTDEERDLSEITHVVEQIANQPSAVYAPAATGGFTQLRGLGDAMLDPHPDHVTVREVALRLRPPETPTYLYAEIPYASGDARGGCWPHSVIAFTPVLEQIVGEPLELLVYEHPEESLARRLAAVGRYRTQLRHLEQGVGPFTTGEILTYEVCWRLPPLRRA